MTQVAIVYFKQGRYGQTLKADIAVDDFSTRGFDEVCRVSDLETGVEIAGKRQGSCFKTSNRK
jgi:hypothetical protein